MKQKRPLLIITFLTLFYSTAGLAEYDIHTHWVNFKKGKSSETFHQAVIRGDRDWYILHAQAQQSLTLKITSLENNAEFQVYLPGYKVLPKDNEGITALSGKVFSEDKKIVAAESENTSFTYFKNVVPETGNYLIAVSGTRGNADYTLDIAIQ